MLLIIGLPWRSFRILSEDWAVSACAKIYAAPRSGRESADDAANCQEIRAIDHTRKVAPRRSPLVLANLRPLSNRSCPNSCPLWPAPNSTPILQTRSAAFWLEVKAVRTSDNAATMPLAETANITTGSKYELINVEINI